jgi:DeoR family fructose operon transcriptional repressor
MRKQCNNNQKQNYMKQSSDRERLKYMDKQNKSPLFAEERKQKILDLLKEKSKLMVPDLCIEFGVSPATIRNDLRELENAGLLKRTHGGAINVSKTSFELNSYQKQVTNLEEKKAIAKLAIDLIEDGDTIALDTGTTTLELAKILSEKKNITVVLNDIEIACYLENEPDIDVILIGGSLRKGFHCTVGPIAVKSLHGLYVDKAFMATNGISVRSGITTPNVAQAEVKTAMINMASEIMVLCDSSKIGNNSFVQVYPISGIDRIITDDGIDKHDVDEFMAAGVFVDIARVR